jgi:osmotically-inducible protein OsmY
MNNTFIALIFIGVLTSRWSAPSSAATQAEQTTAGESIDDSVITSRVKSRFAKDAAVRAMDIHVETEKGIITLSGKVGSKAEKNKAAEIA